MAIIKGTGGADTLTGASGDFVYGYGGNDFLYSQFKNNILLDGGSGDDHFSVYHGQYVKAIGGTGNDSFAVGGFSNKSLFDGGSGNDSFSITSITFDSSVAGGDGNDVIKVKLSELYPTQAGGSRYSISGGSGDDRIEATSGYSTISGDSGNDVIIVSSSDYNHNGQIISSWHIINGGGGNDYIDASNIKAPMGYIVANGDSGADTVIGSASFDSIYGGTGSDVINGNAGNDILAGNSETAGDRVRDTFVFSNTDDAQTDTILKFEHGIDKVQLASPYAWTTMWSDATNSYLQYGFAGSAAISQITFAGVTNVTTSDIIFG